MAQSESGKKSERQMSYDSTQRWNLRNKTNRKKRQTEKQNLKYREQTDGYLREGR